MPTGPNPILSSSNTFIAVTNYAAYTGASPPQAAGVTNSVQELGCIPLTTSDNSATGQICLPVKVVAGGSGASNYTSNIVTATSNGNVPSGVYGWSITALSGTVTVGGQSLPVGASVGGGGYGGATSLTQVAYTVSGGSALISYDN